MQLFQFKCKTFRFWINVFLISLTLLSQQLLAQTPVNEVLQRKDVVTIDLYSLTSEKLPFDQYFSATGTVNEDVIDLSFGKRKKQQRIDLVESTASDNNATPSCDGVQHKFLPKCEELSPAQRENGSWCTSPVQFGLIPNPDQAIKSKKFSVPIHPLTHSSSYELCFGATKSMGQTKINALTEQITSEISDSLWKKTPTGYSSKELINECKLMRSIIESHENVVLDDTSAFFNCDIDQNKEFGKFLDPFIDTVQLQLDIRDEIEIAIDSLRKLKESTEYIPQGENSLFVRVANVAIADVNSTTASLYQPALSLLALSQKDYQQLISGLPIQKTGDNFVPGEEQRFTRDIRTKEHAMSLIAGYKALKNHYISLATFLDSDNGYNSFVANLDQNAKPGDISANSVSELINATEELVHASQVILSKIKARESTFTSFTNFVGTGVYGSAGIAATSSTGYATTQNHHISIDAGLAYATGLKTGLPYIGINLYTRPINRNVSIFELRNTGVLRAAHRWSFNIGITLSEIDDNGMTTKDLIGKNSLILGAGYRLTDVIRLNAGTLVFQEKTSLQIENDHYQPTFSPYFGISFDWDLVQNPGFKSFFGQ